MREHSHCDPIRPDLALSKSCCTLWIDTIADMRGARLLRREPTCHIRRPSNAWEWGKISHTPEGADNSDHPHKRGLRRYKTDVAAVAPQLAEIRNTCCPGIQSHLAEFCRLPKSQNINLKTDNRPPHIAQLHLEASIQNRHDRIKFEQREPLTNMPLCW